MKTKFVLLLLCFSLASAMEAKAKTVLPDACGDDKIKFDVKTEKDQPAPSAPAPGKAQIAFVEDGDVRVGSFGHPIVRYGLDGTWVGANYGNSYFTVDVEPGVHHLCANWQSSNHALKKSVNAASFTAEPGKVYYFAVKTGYSGGGGGYVAPTMGANGAMTGGGMVQGAPGNVVFILTQLPEDEGKYRVKAWKLATWKTK
jgi:hypothetical protein